MIYDITRTVRPTLAVWTGDTPYSAAPMLRIAHGASVNLTTLTLSPHTGAHADAVYHYDDSGAHPAAMSLQPYLGRARVITLQRRTGALSPDDFAPGALAGAERVLLHSWVSDEVPDEILPTDFAYLSVELIAWLSGQGVVLIGLDAPSVDEFTSKTLPCHHALKRHGMVNLENLYLRGVPDGDYELIALPLKLDLACGSPVRAILRTF
jgi:arylformamidase